jgi:Astacin (Peptidase family M12A)
MNPMVRRSINSWLIGLGLVLLAYGCGQTAGAVNQTEEQTLEAWPEGNVAYSFLDGINPDQAQRIRQYMMEMEAACSGTIAFTELTEEAYDAAKGRHIVAIYAAQSSESRASLGLADYPQLEVGQGLHPLTEPSVIKHELFHVLGFRHELQRPDRDQYIMVHMENIRKDKLPNFKIYGDELYDIHHIAYDPKSISNYGYHKYSFCLEAKPVLEPLDDGPSYLATGLSSGDVAKVMAVYDR